MTGSAPPIRSVGLIGYGAFARLAAAHLAPYVRLYAFDPMGPHDGTRDGLGVAHTDIAGAAGCDAIVLATPVSQLSAAIGAIRDHLRPGALVLDVASVKVIPARIMLELLPAHVDIVGAHPLFGPQSARNGVRGLKIALCPLRGARTQRLAAFLRSKLGLKVYLTTPDQHDRDAATVQGLTHLIAKVLVQMEPLPGELTTKSFDRLLEAIDMVRHDPPEVFDAIERLNPYSQDVRERFVSLVASLNDSLSSK